MIVVDSSGWIEFLQGTPRASLFEAALTRPDTVIVPSMCVFEVHRLISNKQSETVADAAITLMQKARVVPLDANLARQAAIAARRHHLAMADAIIYATALSCHAELWTQDAHFKDLPGVRLFPKPC